MPSPKKTVPGFNRFSGLAQGILRWAGARRSGNAASIPPNMFRDLENVRFEGQDITCRGGQVKYNPDAVLEGCIDGFIPPEFEPRDHADRLLIIGVRDIGNNQEIQPYIWISGLQEISDSNDAGIQNAVCLSYVPGASAGGAGGAVYCGRGHRGDDIASGGNSIVTPDMSDVLEFSDLWTDAEDDAAAYGEIAELDGTVYGVHANDNNGVGTAKVVEDPFGTPSDAEVATGDETVGGYYPMWLRNVNDQYLVAPLEPDALHFLESGGAWSTATIGASARAHRIQPAAAATMNSVFYFTGLEVGGGYTIFSWTPGALSTAAVRTLAGIPGGFTILGIREAWAPLCFHNGVLWYAYRMDSLLDADDGTVTLGTYDGTDFTDVVFQFPTDDHTAIRQLISFKNRLWALRGDSLWSAEFPHRFWRKEAEGSALFAHSVVHPVV